MDIQKIGNNGVAKVNPWKTMHDSGGIPRFVIYFEAAVLGCFIVGMMVGVALDMISRRRKSLNKTGTRQ